MQEALIDKVSDSDLGALVKEDRVHTSLYNDEHIFKLEMEKIFGRTWVWVAHESEVPNPGDFVTTHVGLQPAIVVRDKRGTVHVHLNRCRHRAATVCEARKGNAKGFVCPYHGWSYAQDGSMLGVPLPKGYSSDFDKADYALVSLRVESYAGLIFATFNDEAPSLDEFLGRAKPWIDLFMKQGGGYPVGTSGEHKFRFPGNWKIQLENTTDAYHFPIVHKSFLNSLDAQAEELFSFLDGDGFVEDLGNGHSVMVMIPELVDLEENLDAPIPERFKELAEELAADYSDEEVRRIVRAVGGSGFNLNLFPNLACSMAFFRVLRPVSVEETEIRHIAITMDGGPEAANRKRLRLHEHFQGPMGFGSPDDAEAWERVQRGSKAGPDMWIMLNRGTDGDGNGPGGVNRGDVSAETGMRAAYDMWKRMMTA
ncbi:aromatic ring-hydroxylating oxygenase subunit alpha [Kordiimonas pumila]|uniref:Rieske 2Fe-2S domain-containing protein n=1 Tax=Kordiimonas pumila TaxID=2161677 RepID=A0ABV7D519_9PROT|nr:aromatic ring-hydroxylating dioxygenase subunit alpha [Kordiimonas pumila]